MLIFPLSVSPFDVSSTIEGNKCHNILILFSPDNKTRNFLRFKTKTKTKIAAHNFYMSQYYRYYGYQK